jgi:hypothetical protein
MMRKILLIMLSLSLAAAQSTSDRLEIELQSLLVGAGTGIPTLIVINSTGETLTTINLPSPDSGFIWSDPFTMASIWKVQRGGATYTLSGDVLLKLFQEYGNPLPTN